MELKSNIKTGLISPLYEAPYDDSVLIGKSNVKSATNLSLKSAKTNFFITIKNI